MTTPDTIAILLPPRASEAVLARAARSFQRGNAGRELERYGPVREMDVADY